MSSGGNIRIVKYNEDLFKVPSRTQKRKKPDKPIKLKSPKKVSNKSIKNSILKEIRKNQERKYNAMQWTQVKTNTNPKKKYLFICHKAGRPCRTVIVPLSCTKQGTGCSAHQDHSRN
jgi:hypothetical protein